MIALCVGLLVGAILGLTGAGGSVVALPLLYHLLELPAHTATGVSLGAVAASAWFGVITRVSKNEIVWLPGIIFAITGAILAPPGQFLARFFSETMIIAGFTGLMLFLGYRMWRQAMTLPDEVKFVRARAERVSLPMQILVNPETGGTDWRKIAQISLGGLVTGLMSGFFGVGGGFIIVPILVLVTGIGMKQAVGTSLFIVAMISSSGFMSFVSTNAEMSWALLGLIATGGMLGMLGGTLLGQKLAGPTLQKLFAGFVVLLALVNLHSLLLTA